MGLELKKDLDTQGLAVKYNWVSQTPGFGKDMRNSPSQKQQYIVAKMLVK